MCSNNVMMLCYRCYLNRAAVGWDDAKSIDIPEVALNRGLADLGAVGAEHTAQVNVLLLVLLLLLSLLLLLHSVPPILLLHDSSTAAFTAAFTATTAISNATLHTHCLP
jgi:hypothetical protein